LGIGGLFRAYSNAIFDCNVGIGTINPGAKLEVAGQIKITGGSPGAGKVLTSDASGLASWQTPKLINCGWYPGGDKDALISCPLNMVVAGWQNSADKYGCCTARVYYCNISF